jgi:uridine kinase
MTPEDRAARNFDHPDAVDWSLLHRHLEQLAAGRAVRTPAYDFATHTRRPGFGEVVEPGRMAFVEGIFALYDPAIRALCDVRLYVNAGHACCLARRLARDQRERRRTPAFIERQFRETVAPMAEAYVWPSRTHADAIIPGELDPEAALRQAVAVIEGLRSGRPPAARPGGTPRSGGGRSHP